MLSVSSWDSWKESPGNIFQKMPTNVWGLFKSQMGLSLLPSTNVRPTFHSNSLNVIKAFRFAMSLAFFYVKIHCGATGCDACNFSLSQQKRKRYQIIGQYVANSFTHRTAQITMSQLLRWKKKQLSTTLESLYWVCLASFPVFFRRLLFCVSQRAFCSCHHLSERIGRKCIHFSVRQRQKVVFSLFWRLFELYLNRWGPRQYVTNIYRGNSSFAWGEKRPL